jgi:hypothetical protein
MTPGRDDRGEFHKGVVAKKYQGENVLELAK